MASEPAKRASEGAITGGSIGDNDLWYHSMFLGVAWMASKESSKSSERASKSAERASEPVLRASEMVERALELAGRVSKQDGRDL